MPKIIVVDDSAVDRHFAGNLLAQRPDYSVRVAADGKEALQLMAAEVPDVVLADLQMPEMDGLQLVAAIKANHPFVPVILMTAQGSEDIAARALRVGAASYVPKKNLARDLLPTVGRVLQVSEVDRRQSSLMNYLESAESVLVLPNDQAMIKALVHHVQALLRCLPLGDETERVRVDMALEEALNNALYHGNLEVGPLREGPEREANERLAARRFEEAPYRDRRIRVSIRVSRDEAVFVVRDEGPGFDVARLAPVAGLPDPALGRGIVLMRASMDEVRYNAAGNEVTLVKRRAPEPPTSQDAGGPDETLLV